MTPLGQLIDRLGKLPIAETQSRMLQQAAEQLREAVTANLSHAPGGTHDMPWLQTGELRDSISAAVDTESAVVGSTSVVAAAQELGTATIPPRPFLAPAARHGEQIAEAIGAAFAAVLLGKSPE